MALEASRKDHSVLPCPDPREMLRLLLFCLKHYLSHFFLSCHEFSIAQANQTGISLGLALSFSFSLLLDNEKDDICSRKDFSLAIRSSSALYAVISST